MLSKAARRRDTLRHLKHVSEQIQLPWLCPALLRSYTQSPKARPITSNPAEREAIHLAVRSPPSRHLASAAVAVDAFDNDDTYLPFRQPNARLRTVTPHSHSFG